MSRANMWTTRDIVAVYLLKEEKKFNNQDIGRVMGRTPSAIGTVVWKLDFLLTGKNLTDNVSFTRPWFEAEKIIKSGKLDEFEGYVDDLLLPVDEVNHTKQVKNEYTDLLDDFADFLDQFRAGVIQYSIKIATSVKDGYEAELSNLTVENEKLRKEVTELKKFHEQAKTSNTKSMLQRAMNTLK